LPRRTSPRDLRIYGHSIKMGASLSSSSPEVMMFYCCGGDHAASGNTE
jgi:hypothetical protein